MTPSSVFSPRVPSSESIVSSFSHCVCMCENWGVGVSVGTAIHPSVDGSVRSDVYVSHLAVMAEDGAREELVAEDALLHQLVPLPEHARPNMVTWWCVVGHV